jgi:dihydrofolate synthase/folylpolyglutamate synthase
VYNTYADKEYETILRILRPRIERVEILPVQNERIVARDELEKSLRKLGIIYKTFERIHPDEKYLVYGSFSVVEEFMKKYGC